MSVCSEGGTVGFLSRLIDGTAKETVPRSVGLSRERAALYVARRRLANCVYEPSRAALWAEVDYWEMRLRAKDIYEKA